MPTDDATPEPPIVRNRKAQWVHPALQDCMREEQTHKSTKGKRRDAIRARVEARLNAPVIGHCPLKF